MATLAFFGTPDFAVPSLKALVRFCKNNQHELVLVVTRPDQKQNRGQKLKAPVIKEEAKLMGLNIEQPISLKKGSIDGDNFFSIFSGLNIDLAVVVAYGKIITSRLLQIPKIGFINVHASLLPKYRGAAPIQRSIINGETITGVSLMELVLALDEGDVYAKEKTLIMPFDTSDSLSFRLSHLGAHLLENNLKAILDRKLKKTPQDKEKATYADMLKKEEGLINFNDFGKSIEKKVKGLFPWPNAYGFINGIRIKYFDCFFIKTSKNFRKLFFGRVALLNPYLGVECLDGIVYFKFLQWEGGKILKSNSALQSAKLKIGDFIN